MGNKTHGELLVMKANGDTLVEIIDGGRVVDSYHWPFCIIAGCTNRACLKLNSPRCYPHTLPGVPRPTDEVEELAEVNRDSQ